MNSPSGVFQFRGTYLPYCTGEYNHAAYNERAVEVAVGLRLLGRTSSGALEVGAVLPHYVEGWGKASRKRHLVVDLREDYPGVENADVLAYEPRRSFQRVISISTIDHLRGPDEALEAVNRMKSWLSSDGLLYVTAPYGQVGWLDELLLANAFGMDVVHRYDHIGELEGAHVWVEQPLDARPRGYREKFGWANTVYLMLHGNLGAATWTS